MSSDSSQASTKGEESRVGASSSPHLSKSQQDEFFERGWLVLPSLFKENEVAPLREAFGRLHSLSQELKSTQTYNDAYFVLEERAPQVIIKRICWAGGAERALLECSEDARIIQPVSELLESREMEQLLNQAHFKLPGDGVSFDWHQDVQHRDKGQGNWKDLNGKGSYVQTILLLDDMTSENGPVEFLPGSSQWGRVFGQGYDYDTPLSDVKREDDIDYSTAVEVTGKAGDLLLFGPYAVHGSRANRSQKPRRVLINGYAYPGANSRQYPGVGSCRKLRI